MDRFKLKWAIALFPLSACVLTCLVVSTGTYNFLEGTMNSTRPGETGCLHFRYGLFTQCNRLCSETAANTNATREEECEKMDYDVFEVSGKKFGGDPKTEMSLFFSALAFGMVFFLILLLPACVGPLSQKCIGNVAGYMTACKILCIIFVSIFTYSITYFMEDKLGSLPKVDVSIKRGYSYYVTIAFCLLAIPSGIGPLFVVYASEEDTECEDRSETTPHSEDDPANNDTSGTVVYLGKSAILPA